MFDALNLADASLTEGAASTFSTRYVGGRGLHLEDHLGSTRAVVSDLELGSGSSSDYIVDNVSLLKSSLYLGMVTS